MNIFKLLVVSRFGIEKITATEMKDLGYKDLLIQDGQITTFGTLKDVARLNVFLRTAERVMIVLSEFEATVFEELYQGVKKMIWRDIIPRDAFIHITAKSVRSELFSVRDIQSISKKAIVDNLLAKYGGIMLPETGERYRIEIGIYKNIVSVMLDTTGDGLHKRGYRTLTGEAPLSETLAAAIVLLSYWNSDKTLIDPFCGLGTIPIEAALIGSNRAPGAQRSFRAMNYKNFFDPKLFDLAKEEAADLVKQDTALKIQGSDIDREAVGKARFHARQAGVQEQIYFHERDVKDISSRDKYGVIIANPPYGERLLGSDQTARLYEDMKKSFDRFDTWSKYILSANLDFESIYGVVANKRRKLYNGMIECCLYQYFGPKPPQ